MGMGLVRVEKDDVGGVVVGYSFCEAKMKR